MFIRLIIAGTIFIALANSELKKASVKKVFHPKTTTTTAPEVPTLPPEQQKIKIFADTTPKEPRKISPDDVQKWAQEISETFYEIEQQVVPRERLLKAFAHMKAEPRNGGKIVDKMAATLEGVLKRRMRQADRIRQAAETLFDSKEDMDTMYRFLSSKNMDQWTNDDVPEKKEAEWTKPMNCTQLPRRRAVNNTHYGHSTAITYEDSSVQVATEVFGCDEIILKHIMWSNGLLTVFKQNYVEDAITDFQYFCSAKGFLRHYPAAVWSSMFTLDLGKDVGDVYDCRLRPWYVAASGAPRDLLILLDSSGSMLNYANQNTSVTLVLTLLNALTDDDYVNVLKFNVTVEPLIRCYGDQLVPANHINTAAIEAAMRTNWDVKNETNTSLGLRHAVEILKKQSTTRAGPPACQQAIVLIMDTLERNYTELMMEIDPSGQIRVFVIWLHDVYGLRDNTRQYTEWLSCTRDGTTADLVSSNDVTEQVMRILRALERPLVAQRAHRLTVFSGLYVHLEDPRRAEYQWVQRELEEQALRYKRLRQDKAQLMSEQQRYDDWQQHLSLDRLGHYYEGQDDYRYMISVTTSVFESTLEENITIILNEEKLRPATRTYPVNRLLGVAGIDIPVDHLRKLFPYHELGPGGSLFLVDHRGHVILHDNFKPTFDVGILKPGYGTVDVLEVEQPAVNVAARDFPPDWREFRKAMLIDEPKGKRRMDAQYIFEYGMRSIWEPREYYWRRVMDHYTAVVSLPIEYDTKRVVTETAFTKQLAIAAKEAMASSRDHSIHPDWLYCSYVDPVFTDPYIEMTHFINRRIDEPNFKMQSLKHPFSPFNLESQFEKPYQCNEELMSRLCSEAVATEAWVPRPPPECSACQLGSVTAFFAGESGLTRWQHYLTPTGLQPPPEGSVWARAVDEPWYRRAAATRALVVHAPVVSTRHMRVSEDRPPELGERYSWLTAARALSSDRGVLGVAGYHFYPEHLDMLLETITDTRVLTLPECQDTECARCNGTYWSCVLVDEGGWVVAEHPAGFAAKAGGEGAGARHLAHAYPHAAAALLSARVYTLAWSYDYQGVCFPIQEDGAATLPSILRSLWHAAYGLVMIARELVTVFSLLSSARLTSTGGDTEKDREKRRRKLQRDLEREQYERLYDPRVRVNRTRPRACDRARALYQLQRSQLKLLQRPVSPCSWPLVGAAVPRTNLLLLAVYAPCAGNATAHKAPDPLDNKPVEDGGSEWASLDPHTRKACRRHRAPLPARAPDIACYPHNYAQEKGYRQCEPWVPDDEKDT